MYRSWSKTGSVNLMRRVPYVLVVVGLLLVLGAAWVYLSGRSSDSGGLSAQAVSAAGEGQTEPAGPGAAEGGDDGHIRTDDGAGSVELSAAPLLPSVLADNSWLAERAGTVLKDEEFGIFIGLNTHSVDLSGYDLAALSSMSSPAGEARPLRYVAEQDGTHHRTGILVFEGGQVDLEGRGELVLTVAEVSGIPERVLSWPLPAG
jgi:hypothetical protein